jgi:hypothetical protein
MSERHFDSSTRPAECVKFLVRQFSPVRRITADAARDAGSEKAMECVDPTSPERSE